MPTLANVSIKDDANWSTFLDMIYPVGSYYISNSSTTPASKFGGTWTQVTNRFLYGYTSITTGGNNNAIVVSHNHSASSSNAGAHTHNAYNPSNYAGFGLFISGTGANAGVSATHYIQSTGNSGHLWTRTASSTASAGSHTHTVTVSSKGESGTYKNMPQYRTAYMWYRTA